MGPGASSSPWTSLPCPGATQSTNVCKSLRTPSEVVKYIAMGAHRAVPSSHLGRGDKHTCVLQVPMWAHTPTHKLAHVHTRAYTQTTLSKCRHGPGDRGSQSDRSRLPIPPGAPASLFTVFLSPRQQWSWAWQEAKVCFLGTSHGTGPHKGHPRLALPGQSRVQGRHLPVSPSSPILRRSPAAPQLPAQQVRTRGPGAPSPASSLPACPRI